jgi:hypothetical protein
MVEQFNLYICMDGMLDNLTCFMECLYIFFCCLNTWWMAWWTCMFDFCIRLYVLYLIVSIELKLVIIIFPGIYISSGS